MLLLNYNYYLHEWCAYILIDVPIVTVIGLQKKTDNIYIINYICDICDRLNVELSSQLKCLIFITNGQLYISLRNY